MKIKTVPMSYDDVTAIPPEKHQKPKRVNLFFRVLLKLVSLPDLLAVRFRCKRIGMEKLGKREPCLILMNHSSFVDLEIAASVLFPRAFNIVATTDGFVGKRWLMRQIGCIPTKKFVSEMGLIRDIAYAIKTQKSSVLMYPEASYSFDGTATPLPDSLGKFVKHLGVPVVLIRTYGAFSRDPLYNNLQRRKVKVSADLEYFLSPGLKKTVFYQIAFNPTGKLYQGTKDLIDGVSGSLAVKGMVVKSVNTDKNWQAEVFIPFAGIKAKTPAPYEVWFGNVVYAQRRTESSSGNISASFAFTMRNTHNVDLWGQFKFMGIGD